MATEYARTALGGSTPEGADCAGIQPNTITYSANGSLSQTKLGNGFLKRGRITRGRSHRQSKLGVTAGRGSVRGLTFDYGGAANNGNLPWNR
jgi:hypothetical protein